MRKQKECECKRKETNICPAPVGGKTWEDIDKADWKGKETYFDERGVERPVNLAEEFFYHLNV